MPRLTHCLLCLTLLATLALPCGTSAAPDSSGPAFPRLVMWYPTHPKTRMEDRARFDLFVGDFSTGVPGERPSGRNKGQTLASELRRANGSTQLLTYYRPLVIRPSSLYEGTRKHNPLLGSWPVSWFMTEAGSSLAAPLGAGDTQLKVVDWEQSGEAQGSRPRSWVIWKASQDIQVDNEIMTISAVDEATRTLTVQRGMNGTQAAAHAAGTRTAPLARFWRGSYIMNLTDSSGTASLDGAGSAEDYAGYAFRMGLEGANEWFGYISGDQDGFLWDMLPDNLSWLMWTDTRSLDLDRDNVPDSFASLDSAWERALARQNAMFAERFPGKAIVRNQSRSRDFDSYNGESFVSFPHDQWNGGDPNDTEGWTRFWHDVFLGGPEEARGGIAQFQQGSVSPNFTQIITDDLEMDLDSAGFPELKNPETASRFKPNYRKMRWGLCSALLCGSYYGYVITTDGYGLRGIEWFDEYDDAGSGRGYLGFPQGEMQQLSRSADNADHGVWGREYDNGYVLVNPLERAVEVQLPAGKWQRIRGTQVPEVNSGAVEEGTVTVPAFDGLILKRM
ncbi:MAG: hypothetical protein R3F46_02080 [bacterium]